MDEFDAPGVDPASANISRKLKKKGRRNRGDTQEGEQVENDRDLEEDIKPRRKKKNADANERGAVNEDIDNHTSKHTRKKKKPKQEEVEDGIIDEYGDVRISKYESTTDPVENHNKSVHDKKAKRKSLKHINDTLESLDFETDRPKSRSRRTKERRYGNSINEPDIVDSNELDEELPKSRAKKSKKKYSGNEVLENNYEEDAAVRDEGQNKEHRKQKPRKKSKQPLADDDDQEQVLASQDISESHRRRKKKKREKEEENEDFLYERRNGENDNDPLNETLSKSYGPNVTVHPTRIVMCKPKAESDTLNYDFNENVSKVNSRSNKKSRKDNSGDRDIEAKKKSRKKKVDESVVCSDLESDFEPLTPMRKGSYLDNDLSKYRKSNKKPSHNAEEVADFENFDASPKPEKTGRKKGSLAKLVQKKKQQSVENDIDSPKSNEKLRNKTTDMSSDKDTSPVPSRLIAKHIESDDSGSYRSRQGSLSKPTTSASPKSRKAQSNHGSRSENKSSVMKTSVMPFRLSDDSSSEEEVSNPSVPSFSSGNTGDAPRNLGASQRKSSVITSTSKRDSAKKRKPPPVRENSLFTEELDREESSDDDEEHEVEDEDERSESEIEPEVTPPPKHKSKKDKKKDKKRKDSVTDSIASKDGKTVKSHGKVVDTLRYYANGTKPSPNLDGKPPRPQRKSVHGYPGPQRPDSPTGSLSSTASMNWIMKGIFSIDGHTYDVFMKGDRINWTCVTGATRVPKSRRKSYVRRISESSLTSLEVDIDTEEKNTLFYRDMLGVAVRRDSKKGHKEGGGVCLGIKLFTFDEKEGTRLKVREINLDHPSESECVRWVDKIRQYLDEFEDRPKRIKVFLQPFAGKKQGMLTYNTIVQPIFEAADLEVDFVRVNHNEHIKQEMAHLVLDDFDCVVCIGGDGTVSRVINQVLTREQAKNGVEMTVHLTPLKSPIRIGVVPTGMTNQIVQSVQGVADPATAVIHIVMGNTKPVDICTVFKDDVFYKWTFMSHYGYFGNTLSFLGRYTLLGEKKLEAAFVKALTKSKLRAYQCEVKYIPVSEKEYGTPTDHKACLQECSRCRADLDLSNESVYSDVIEALNQNDSEEEIELDDGKTPQARWKTVKGDFLSLSLLSIPGRGEYCPLGMSKYGHLSNGCLDVIMVNSATKKDFTRYLKRHGNEKDQLELPFVESVRCKEVRFALRLKNTWKHTDHGFNEIDYEVERQEKTQQIKEKLKEEVDVIDDLGDDNEGFEPDSSSADSDSDSWSEDSEEDANVSMFTTSKAENDEEEKVTDKKSKGKKEEKKGHKRQGSLASTQSKHKENKDSDYIKPPQDYIIDQDRARRKKHRAKKDRKKQEKAERKMRSYWCMDNELHPDMNLHFKVHGGLLSMFGSGVKRDFDPHDVKMGCLSMF